MSKKKKELESNKTKQKPLFNNFYYPSSKKNDIEEDETITADTDTHDTVEKSSQKSSFVDNELS